MIKRYKNIRHNNNKKPNNIALLFQRKNLKLKCIKKIETIIIANIINFKQNLMKKKEKLAH